MKLDLPMLNIFTIINFTTDIRQNRIPLVSKEFNNALIV